MALHREKRTFRLPPPLVPPELAGILIKCEQCQIQFRPPWASPLELPLTPRTQASGDGYLVPAEAKVRCPRCTQIARIELPYTEIKAWINLFGDEAYRNVSQKYLHTYSLVGGEPHVVDKLSTSLDAIKKEFAPEHASWKVHMKELWSPHERNRHHIFKEWSDDKVQSFVNRIGELLESNSHQAWIFNMSGILRVSGGNPKKKIVNYARDEVFSALLLYAIAQTTKQGGRPFFTFDATREIKASPHVEGWAVASFLGSQCSLLYGYQSHGIPVDPPKFVPPASHPCLELADFVSYFVARHIEHTLSKKVLDYDIRKLGTVNYLAFDGHGNLQHKRDSTYPWELFFGKPKHN